MRVVEVVRGLGIGGLEVSLARRLKYSPSDVWTGVISTQPSLNALSNEVRNRADLLVEIDIGRWGSRALIEQITLLDPDLIVTHVPRETIKILLSPLPNAIPVVVVAHHPQSSERAWARAPITAALKRGNPKAALHIAVSAAAANGSQCLGAKRVEVLPLGAELEEGAPDASPWPNDCKVRLLSLGRLRAFKNLDNLLHAVALTSKMMREHQAFLAVVGDGAERQRLTQLIEHLGISDLVAMVPASTNPSGILHAADVMVITSMSEGGPITAVEALLAGCHLISTQTGILPELAAQHANVSLIQDPSTEAIACALEAALLAGPVSSQERAANRAAAQGWTMASTSTGFYQALRSLSS